MTTEIVKVGFPYVQDLYYRIRHASLSYQIYCLDFYDWIKAGIAYNTRGLVDPRRKVAYFVKLYRMLQDNGVSAKEKDLRQAVLDFYEDLFLLYQDHLQAQLKASRKRGTVRPSDLILLPSFEQVPFMFDILPVKRVEIALYECKNFKKLQRDMSAIFNIEDTLLFRSMAVYYDYGVQREGNGVILEVK